MILAIIIFIMLLVTVAYAQSIPEPITDKLPLLVETVLGGVSAFVVEFIQKQKSPLASLGIAVGVSTAAGVVASFLVPGIDPDNLPVFIVQVWAMATASWAVLFKTMNLSKIMGTSDT